MLISFEGIDGVGKTMCANMLFQHLSSKHECVITAEPSQGPIGKLIRQILRTRKSFDSLSMQLLFSADRSYHVSKVIIPALEKNKIVITDRYALSTIAYGAASGLDKGFLSSINSKFPEPDLTFIITADPEKAIERIKARAGKFIQKAIESYPMPEYSKEEMQKTEMFERIEFLKRVIEAYSMLAKERENVFIINNSNTIEDAVKEVIKIAEERI